MASALVASLPRPCLMMKRLFRPKAKNGLIMKRLFALQAKNGLIKKQKTIKIRPTQNTPRNPQPPGHRDQLETARDETRPTRQPILARFLHISRVCRNQPRLYTYIPALLLLCRLLYSFGALFSRQRSFCFLYCDMYLRFRGCPVVLDIELYGRMVSEASTCTVLLRTRCLLMLLLLAADSKEWRCEVCGITFKI